MSRRKAFRLRIEIDVHTVHLDDINLCRSGSVALRVHTLSSIAVTMPAQPLFPIHFREKLIFEKVMDCVSTLAEIQDRLNREPVKMELVQWPKRCSVKPKTVSRFRTQLSSLLFPALTTNDLSHGGDIKIDLEPSENFGGATGANVEVSTKLTISETTSHRARVSEPEKICSNNQMQQNKWYNCCRRNVKTQSPTCGCSSTDHDTRKPKSRQKKPNNRCIQIRETSSCNNCSICNCYSGYFDPKRFFEFRPRSCSCVKTCNYSHEPKTRINPGPTLSSSLSSLGSCTENSKFAGDQVENPVSHRQLFYENLDLFYRRLRDKKQSPHKLSMI